MKFTIILLTTLLVTSAATAQTRNAKTEQEIIDFRAEVSRAVKEKDRIALLRFFADGFTHTHASGKVDGKRERVEFFLAGEPTIEDVAPDEIRVTVFNKNLALANGKTTLLFGTEERRFQWTGVFLKEKGKWKVLTTHATALRN